MDWIPSVESRSVDAVLLGRAAVDFNPVDYYKPLSQSMSFKRYLGGSPANIAVGLARLDQRVSFIGKVSDDAFGDFVVDFFRNEGILVDRVRRAGSHEHIGLTFTEMLSPESSSILMVRDGAADLALNTDEVDMGAIASARCLLISGTALSRPPSREAALKALTLARLAGTPVIFDADYRPYGWASADETAVYMSMAAERGQVILGSRDEFDRMERLLGLGGTDDASADYWRGMGARIVIIKHGKDGSRAYTESGVFEVKPFPVTPIKGFGGGDGYASAFLNGLLTGLPMEESLEMASASAAILVASHSCSQDMPSILDIRLFIIVNRHKAGRVVTRIG
ncbi:MAG: 5-dehydro-2-deoxygluconokinase [Oscillospiraceae bacterium]|nr:5-dehydro-2-deoxygluconokinase [Oscillospiraceae bacterium]